MKWTLLFALPLFLFSCNSNTPTNETVERSLNDTLHKPTTIRYAQRFSVTEKNGYKVIYVLGDKTSKDTTACYVLYPREQAKPSFQANAFYIPVPAQRVACMSSLYAGMLHKLGLDQRIVAVDNVDYYMNEWVTEGVRKGNVQELSKGPEIDVERTLVLRPELILAFGMGNPGKDMNPKITRAGIPVAISIEHLEDTPLARAEWLKFFALFFQKEQQADSLFTAMEQRYTQLQQKTTNVTTRPTVLTEVKFGDTWYVPGGKSFMASLLNDAGADYFWKADNSNGSLPLSFEAVISKARHCDYWLNVFNCNSKSDLLKMDPRYNQFDAVKKGNVYNNNKQQNAAGYSAYWETGIISPDEILEDMIRIFHPELLSKAPLKYYQQLP